MDEASNKMQDSEPCRLKTCFRKRFKEAVGPEISRHKAVQRLSTIFAHYDHF